MSKKKTIKEIFEEIDEENRKIVEECKRKREEQ